MHDMYFVQVKTPAESARPWDYYKILATIPGDKAFRPMSEGGCPLVAQHLSAMVAESGPIKRLRHPGSADKSAVILRCAPFSARLEG